MKNLKNKDLVKLILNIVFLFITLIFYIISSILKVLFNKWSIIIISVVILTLLLLQIFLNDKEKVKKIIKEINEYTQILLIAMLIVETVFMFIMFPATVDGTSMLPTFANEDQLIVKVTNDYKNNDIVVFKYDYDYQSSTLGIKDNDLLVKRIIAIPGQTFEYIGKELYINDELYPDPFAFEGMDGLDLAIISCYNDMYDKCLQPDGTFKIPEGWYVVFGDNRQGSTDSRAFGLVHESQILGKVQYQLYSIFNWEKIE